MKYFILLFITGLQFSYCQTNNSSNNKKYKINEIGILDDGTYYFKIENDKEKAIIIESNNDLEIKNCIEIKKGKYYSFELDKIETNFRGKNDKYVLISDKGTQTVIWHKKDNYPLLLYKAKNIKGICLISSK